MSRRTISLSSRVRYEGRVQVFDRRPTKGADLEKLPNPIWYTVGQVIRSRFGKPLLGKGMKASKVRSKAKTQAQVVA